jgi:diadenosine tetraphosphate (Ap4A) HIT family hydrolase
MFQLNETLEQDTLAITQWPLCQVRLMNDSRFPWMILVPAREDLREIYEISNQEQANFLTEINKASRTLQKVTGADKMNVAALGNQVTQLHIHIIARFEGDAAWPGPIWGVGEVVPYEASTAKALIKTLNETF